MSSPSTAIVHYTAPPVVGGVEQVIQAHSYAFAQAGYPVTVIAGRGEIAELAPESDLILIPEMDTRDPQVERATAELNQGRMPASWDELTGLLTERLGPFLAQFDNVFLHNVLTMHFNLPLTAALWQLLDNGTVRKGIAWCHDFSWTDSRYDGQLHPGYPWSLLRTFRPDLTYVAVSRRRRGILAQLLGCDEETIRVVYNGVDPEVLLGCSTEGYALIDQLGLLKADVVMLMPVRITPEKNIEYAIQVTALCKAQGLNPRLIITGPPDPHNPKSLSYFSSLQEQRRQAGVEEEVRFIYECGQEPRTISLKIVAELLRVSDFVLMPSHHEGFGIPVVEAGLVGTPIVATDIPAADEIGGGDVIRIGAEQPPEETARDILDWMEGSRVLRLRRRVRQCYTWQAIFERDIRPLFDRTDTA